MNSFERLLQIHEDWYRLLRYEREERDPEEIARAKDRLSARIEAALGQQRDLIFEKEVA